MEFNRLRTSSRSRVLLGYVSNRTNLTSNIAGRFAICLSLKDPSVPNPDEYDENGTEILPSVLFGEYENLFKALLIKRLQQDNLDPEIYLNKMLRAHFNRGVSALFPRIKSLADFNEIIKQERLQ